MVPIVRRAAFLVLKDVVVVGSEKGSTVREPSDKRREIKVRATAGLFEGMIKVAAVDEDSDAVRVLADACHDAVTLFPLPFFLCRGSPPK